MSKASERQPPVARCAQPAPPSGTPAEDSSGSGDPRPADDENSAALDAYIAAMVAAAPPLTSEQRDRLALLLNVRRRRLRLTRGSRARREPAPRKQALQRQAPRRPDEAAGALSRSSLPVVPARHQARGGQRRGLGDRDHVQDHHHRDALGPAQDSDERRQGV